MNLLTAEMSGTREIYGRGGRDVGEAGEMGATDKTSAELTPHGREVPPHHGQSPEPLALEPEASSCMVKGHDLGVAQSC